MCKRIAAEIWIIFLVFFVGQTCYLRFHEREPPFPVVLEPEDEGGFTVRVPAFPEIVTYGKDEREALAMAQDAIRLVIEDCLVRGEPLHFARPTHEQRAGESGP